MPPGSSAGKERRVYYDFADLATIDGCMRRGEAVPETPKLRDELRASLRWRFAGVA